MGLNETQPLNLTTCLSNCKDSSAQFQIPTHPCTQHTVHRLTLTAMARHDIHSVFTTLHFRKGPLRLRVLATACKLASIHPCTGSEYASSNSSMLLSTAKVALPTPMLGLCCIGTQEFNSAEKHHGDGLTMLSVPGHSSGSTKDESP